MKLSYHVKLFILFFVSSVGSFLFDPMHEFGHWAVCVYYGGHPTDIEWFSHLECPEISEISKEHPMALDLYRAYGGGTAALLIGFGIVNRGSKWQLVFSALAVIGLVHGINAIEETLMPTELYLYVVCAPRYLQLHNLPCDLGLQMANITGMLTLSVLVAYLLLRNHEHEFTRVI